MQSSDSIWKLRSLTQQAATAPALWSDVLSELSSAIGCDGAHIWMVGEASPESRLSRQHGSMVDLHAEYGANWAARDPWLGAALVKDAVRPGLAVAGTDVLLDRDLHRTPFYNDFARRVGVDAILALTISGASDRDVPATVMSFKRSHRTFEQAANDKALLQTLWPDLYGAVSAYWALRKVRDSERIVERTLDALPQPIWVVRGDLQVEYANVAAQDLVRATGWIFAAGQRLRQIGNMDAAGIRHRLATSGAGQCTVYRQIPHPPRTAQRAQLRWTPIAPSSPYARSWPLASALLSLELHAPPSADDWLPLLTGRWRLTPAEARVLQRLVAGCEPAEIAAELTIAPSTLHSHVLALLVKSGCRRQVDLVRVVLGG